MKNCRTLSGLLKAMKKREDACLRYTTIFRDSKQGVYEIYLDNPTNTKIVVSEEMYNKIRWNLHQK